MALGYAILHFAYNLFDLIMYKYFIASLYQAYG